MKSSYIFGIIIAAIGGYLAYKYYYLPSQTASQTASQTPIVNTPTQTVPYSSPSLIPVSNSTVKIMKTSSGTHVLATSPVVENKLSQLVQHIPFYNSTLSKPSVQPITRQPFGFPSVKLPTLPTVHLPTFHLPTVHLPTVHLPFSVSHISVPTLSTVHLPTLSSLSNVHLPNSKTLFQSGISAIKSRL